MTKKDTVLVGSIQKFSIEDGPGIRTTIFMKGCPLNCKWCHNPEMIDYKQQLIMSPNNCIGCGYCQSVCSRGAITISQESGVAIDRDRCTVCLECAASCYANALRAVAREMSVDEIMDAAEQDKGFYDNTGGGITLSGGEMLSHAEICEAIIDEAARRDINVCLDTSGYGNGQKLLEMGRRENVTDILYDIKSMDDQIHRSYTGVSNELILSNLRLLAADSEVRKKITLRMPLIAGVNDSQQNIEETGNLISEIGITGVVLLPYHSLGVSKQKNVGGQQEEFQPPSEERLAEIEKYFGTAIGINVEILGKI